MSRRSTNSGGELLVIEQLRQLPRSEHLIENMVKNYAQSNRRSIFYIQLKTVVYLIGCFCFVLL